MNTQKLTSLPSVSIILPTYNRGSSLQVSIPSIINQSYSNWELLVIDDGSTDNTIDILRVFMQQDPRIRYFTNSTRLGQQKTKNRGISLARNALILIGEDDVVFDHECLATLIKTYIKLSNKSEFIVVGPRLIEQNYVYHMDVVRVDSVTGYIYTNYSLNVGKVIEVDTLHSCSLFNKEIFKEIGGFDEKLYRGFAYREETDLYYRIRKNGGHLFFQPAALAHHLHCPSGGSHRGASKFAYGYYLLLNQSLFLIKFYRAKAIFMIPAFVAFSFFALRITSRKPQW